MQNSVVVDFFGIFFGLSWVFYSNEEILNGKFLGYFSYIGEIWIDKVLIGVVPFICGLILFWLLFYMPYIIHESTDGNLFYNICVALAIIICATPVVFLLSCICLIVLETMTFTIIALFVYNTFTSRWWKFDSDHMSNMIKEFIIFIGSASKKYGPNDRIVRILAVNHAMHSIHNQLAPDIYKYMTKKEQEEGINGYNKIRYKDIRLNCKNKKRAKIAPEIIQSVWNGFCHSKRMFCGSNRTSWDKYEGFIGCLLYIVGSISLVFFILAKLFQMFFPYFIIGYLYLENNKNGHHIWHKIDAFQLVMLFTYISLQIVLIILGIIAIQINYWLWHICPGSDYVNPSSKYIVREAIKWYEKIQWHPQIENIVIELYGPDIAHIILDYYENIKIDPVKIDNRTGIV